MNPVSWFVEAIEGIVSQAGNIYWDVAFPDFLNTAFGGYYGNRSTQHNGNVVEALETTDVEFLFALYMEYMGWIDDLGDYNDFYNALLPPCDNLGDLNGDGGWDVLDMTSLVNCVLGQNCTDIVNGCAGDLNGDGGYNVLDITTLANCVLAGNCGG
jgi:hypothetical protein